VLIVLIPQPSQPQQVPAKRTGLAKGTGAGRTPAPQGSKLVSALTALEEPAGGLDPWPGDGVGVRSGPGDLQRRQLFGLGLGIDAARADSEEPTAGQEDLQVDGFS
jgi:hypothetical protein